MRWETSWKQAPCLIALGIFYVVANAVMGLAQQAALSPPQPLPQVRTLLRQAQTRFPGRAPIAALDEMKCDAQGDIYAVYSDTPQLAVNPQHGLLYMPVRKISMDSDSVVAYPVPTITGYVNARRIDFDAAPDGSLYALLAADSANTSPGTARHSDSFIAKYDARGSVISDVKLGPVPDEKTMPLRIAVFPSGNFLVVGLAWAGGEQQAYAAIYDGSGDFLSNLPAPSGISPVPYGPNAPSPTPTQIAADRERAHELAQGVPMPVPAPLAISYTRVVGSSEGNAYILWGTQPQQMAVISPGGEVAQKFNLAAAAPGARALQLGVLNSGQPWVQFYPAPGSPSSNDGTRKTIEVLDASTGRTVNVFQLGPSQDDRAMAGCSDSAGNFLFVNATQDGKALQVLTYTPAGN